MKNCAFSQEALETGNGEVNEHAKTISDESSELKNLVNKNKEELESKIKGLTDAIDKERKKTEEHENAFKDALRMKADVERTFKKEIKELHQQMKKLESYHKDLELRVEDR